jgi:peptide/nickel transport system substrate-binding protein
VPLTARDLRFTWRAVMNRANNTKTLYGLDDISAIDLPDDYAAVIHLKEPNADVMSVFGGGGENAYPPLPEHLLGKLPSLNSSAFNAEPISSGPYLLKEWKHGSSLEFVANPRYWRGKPKLHAISMRIVPNPDTLFNELRTHEIDILPKVAEDKVGQLPNIAGLRVVPHLVASWRHVIFNCSKPALSDARVRLAIAEAVDWDRINATVFHGLNIHAVSDILPDSWAAPNIPSYRHDPADARRLLDGAGWRLGSNGVRARAGTPLRLVVSSTPFDDRSEVQMQQDLREVGIELDIKNYPASFLFAQNGPLYTGTYDLEFSIETNGPDPDNQTSWSGNFIPPHGANTTFLRDAIVTATSATAIRTFDRAKRKALYQREEERIHQLVMAVFVYWDNSRAAYNSDLKNYKPAEYITNNWNAWEWGI